MIQQNASIPNLFVIGVAKCGTTTLHSLLDIHPDINMSSQKEPHFFVDEKNINALTTPTVQTKEEYFKLFDTQKSYQYYGEASPSYSWNLSALKRIKENNPAAKFILILRDPFARVYSHFQMEIHAERERSLSLIKAIQNENQRDQTVWGTDKLYLPLSQYAKVLSHLTNEFEAADYLVLYYEKFFADVSSNLNLISHFLGLQDFQFESNLTKKQNEGSYSSHLMKWLKKLPGRTMIPNSVKVPLKKLVNRNARSINQKEVDFILPYLLNDLHKQYELGYDFYPLMVQEKYGIDLKLK